MSSRERILLLVVGALVLVIGGAIGVPFYLNRLSAANGRVAKAQKGLDDKNRAILTEEAELKRVRALSPRLKDWRKLSLPEVDTRKGGQDAEAHLSRMQVAYQQHLTDVLTKGGLRETVVRAGKYDNKQTPQFAKDKPIYGVQPFSVEAKGSLANLIAVLEGLHKTPLLHQVKSFSLVRPRTTQRGQKLDDIDIKFTVEVLQVTGAEKMVDPKSEDAKKAGARIALLPMFPKEQPAPAVLAMNTRHYPAMVEKNLFNLNPPREVKEEKPKEEKPLETPTRPKEKLADVLAFVRLTGVDYTEGIEDRSPAWEATLFNPSRVDVDEASGKTKLDVTRFRMYHAGNRMRIPDFRILDRYDNELLKGEGVRIESRSVLLLIDRKVYRINLGQSLKDAMEKPLAETELKALGIEIPKEPEKTPDKDTGTKKEPEKKEEKKEPEKKEEKKDEKKDPAKTQDQ